MKEVFFWGQHVSAHPWLVLGPSTWILGPTRWTSFLYGVHFTTQESLGGKNVIFGTTCTLPSMFFFKICFCNHT